MNDVLIRASQELASSVDALLDADSVERRVAAAESALRHAAVVLTMATMEVGDDNAS